ncbi:asparagine synthase-related protein [Saccharothrix algeriensis]|uniref:Asparagine synthase (Glutamine-hydrolyzing) n=1 Tax=Saccharothrix algeriensis TaxID=173560 RepID=A0ABS2S2Y9_9PSEU|nr:asparagine synthase C-terminal domain-containing protein [Saccharothrix algeriensis]MBM7810220.1 asparagine synthase (glutamine-hydrolyzing) [Saccharothrix algeriensis]
MELIHEGNRPPWRSDGGRWVSGASWIEPFRHPNLEDFAATDGTSSLVVVRERASDVIQLGTPEPVALTPPAYGELRHRLLASATDFFMIEQDPQGAFRLYAGQWGNAPVYVVEGRGRLHGSWYYGDLRAHMRFGELHPPTVTSILAGRPRYSMHTLFAPVKQITERMRVTYDPVSGLDFRYPEPAMRALPREIREGVDILDVYEAELQRAVRLWEIDPERTAVELSGGMDSANVAMTLAGLFPGKIRSYALILAGEIGEQQLRRRNAMIDFAGFRDFRVPAIDWPPLHPLGGRALGDPLNPMDEPYHEAVEAMLESATAHGLTTVFTGDGGDELLSLRGEEWGRTGRVQGRNNPHRNPPDWLGCRAVELLARIDSDLAPVTVLNEATHLGFACRTPQFMAAGLWPLSPLASGRLIRFGEQLPVRFREGKFIARERLRRLGFSDDVVHPRHRENFVHVMERGLVEYGVPLVDEYLEESPLVDLGFVDPDRLRAVRDAASTGRIDTRLFGYLRLELGLRGLLS